MKTNYIKSHPLNVSIALSKNAMDLVLSHLAIYRNEMKSK